MSSSPTDGGSGVVSADDIVTTPEAVAAGYDSWAAGYDADLASWGYDAPDVAAATLRQFHRPGAGPVLDVGCGTGLSGRALAAGGFDIVDGVDISAASLEVARATGAYRSVDVVDFQQIPTAIADNSHAAITCVGVMTYLPETEAVLSEFCRIVDDGGTIVFTQRDDLWADRHCLSVLGRLEEAGTCRVISVGAPRDYLPANADVGHIPVRVIALEVLAPTDAV